MIKHNVSLAIIAGGEGKRFHGKTKSKIVIAGRSIITRMLEEVSGIFSEILIVTNTPAEFQEHSDARLIPDTFRGIGPLGGIHAAIKACSCPAVFVVAGDMPLINGELIRKQVELFVNKQPDAVIPKTGEYIEPLHSIYNKELCDRLEDYIRKNKSHAVWEFVKTIDPCWFVPEDEAAASNSFISVNTPDDVRMIEKILLKLI